MLLGVCCSSSRQCTALLAGADMSLTCNITCVFDLRHSCVTQELTSCQSHPASRTASALPHPGCSPDQLRSCTGEQHTRHCHHTDVQWLPMSWHHSITCRAVAAPFISKHQLQGGWRCLKFKAQSADHCTRTT